MDFLSNVKKLFADTGKTVAKKTGELVETSKTKYGIYDVKNDIEKVYTEIGREIYAAYKEDRNAADFIEEKCAEIDVLVEKMETLKAQLEK